MKKDYFLMISCIFLNTAILYGMDFSGHLKILDHLKVGKISLSVHDLTKKEEAAWQSYILSSEGPERDQASQELQNARIVLWDVQVEIAKRDSMDTKKTP